MTKHIPNFLTLLNVLAGCIATVFAAYNQLEYAALFVFIGVVFDFLDGFAARMLKAYSELGLQLDSLADMVTSGLVPGMIMFQLLRMATSEGWTEPHLVNFDGSLGSWLPFAGFVLTMASAYRLAKFNIDTEQTDSFMGLPTPANALFVIALPLILLYQNNEVLSGLIHNPWFLIGVVLANSWLMNARIPLFSLKFKTWGFAGNEVRYIFLALCLVGLLTMKFMAIPAIIVLYVLLSLVNGKKPEPTV